MTTVRGMASLYEPLGRPFAPFQVLDQSRSQPQVADRRSILKGPAPFDRIAQQVGGRLRHDLDRQRLLIHEAGRQRNDPGILQGRLHQVADRGGIRPLCGRAEGNPECHR